MPQPTSAQVHVSRPLTNLSIAYKNAQEDYIAGKVFPELPVAKQRDLYYIYKKDDFFRSIAEKRARGTESAGGGFELETGNYSADVWAVHQDIDDQDRGNQDEAIDLDRDSTEWVTDQILLRRELEWAANYFITGIWTGSTTGTDITPGTLWDASGSDPIFDVRQEARAMKKKTGLKPNKLVVSGAVHDALVDNAAIIDRIKGGAISEKPAIVTKQLLAAVFEVQEYMVAEAIQNTAAKGKTFVGAEIFGKDALLCYSQPNPGLKKPSAGYNFMWTGLLGGRAGLQIARFRIQRIKSDRVEGESAYDQKQTAADLGVLFDNVIS